MLYFAAATTYEHRRHTSDLPGGAAFLCADNLAFRQMVDNLWRQLQTLVRAGEISIPRVAWFERQVAEAVAPYNRVGLCDPGASNMYHYTAAPTD
jgi:hypothetical protein